MPASRLVPRATALLLGLLLLGLSTTTGQEAEKTGVCPELQAPQADGNCILDCHSDNDCADNRKCCPAGCSTLCSMPNGNAQAGHLAGDRAGPHTAEGGGFREDGRPPDLETPAREGVGRIEKPGTCPSVDLPQLGICEDQCQMDSQCPGLMKCCRNGCGKVSCVTPNF
uniref:WAP four-disulfide core domain 2 n=1 Tax=Jaculus jaculus TaxID=51337 RepID=A0A8C5L2Z6_JACJA